MQKVSEEDLRVLKIDDYFSQGLINEKELRQEKQIDDIKITGVKSIHGDILSDKPKPDVIGFLIDNKFYHPGDAIYLEEKPKVEIVFVPKDRLDFQSVSSMLKLTSINYVTYFTHYEIQFSQKFSFIFL